MNTEIRTFVALKIHAENKLLKQISLFKETFKKERINWVAEDNFHLTLRFLGNTTKEQLYELVDCLQHLACNTHSFPLEIKGAGYFCSKGNPRVLFVKTTHSNELMELTQGVEEVVVAIGFHAELKPFKPHLTIGRIKHIESASSFYSKIDEQAEITYQNILISEFVLYQSVLTTQGPIYKSIKTFKFL
jgi:2'-5' RNA ligase